jgi:hypothetical protein
MSKKEIEDVNNFDDFIKMMIFVVSRIHSTPSMVDKLPKYLMERIDRAMDWYFRNGKN